LEKCNVLCQLLFFIFSLFNRFTYQNSVATNRPHQ
jgi:hypothetical protein